MEGRGTRKTPKNRVGEPGGRAVFLLFYHFCLALIGLYYDPALYIWMVPGLGFTGLFTVVLMILPRLFENSSRLSGILFSLFLIYSILYIACVFLYAYFLLPSALMPLLISSGYPVLFFFLEKRRLRQSNRLKIMLAGVGHELKSPLAILNFNLAGLSRYLPVLLEVYERADKHRFNQSLIPPTHMRLISSIPEKHDVIIRETMDMVDVLLVYARGERVDRRNLPELSIKTCIEDALGRFHWTVNDDFCSGSDRVILDIDKSFSFRGNQSAISLVILNILKNSYQAIQSAREGEIFLTSIPATEREKFHRLVIKDTGPGMEPEILKRVFEPFYSDSIRTFETDNVAEAHGHVKGIGLTLAREIIELDGGKMECNSRPGDYTEFIISLR